MQYETKLTQIIKASENTNFHQPYQVSNLAVEIIKIKKQISIDEFLIVSQLFTEKIEQNNQQEILDNRLDYAIRIMESSILSYEELMKLYSVFQECYALKQLGLKTQNDLAEFYEILSKTNKKYAKALNEIEQKFRNDFLESFNYSDKFLSEQAFSF